MIAEARESGTAGIYRADGEVRTGLIDEIAHAIDPDRLIFEAPLREQQVWLLHRFGSECNLGNIAPARRALAGDAAPGPALGHGRAVRAGRPQDRPAAIDRRRPADRQIGRRSVVFALLVLACFAAFFMTQRLKHTPTAVQRFKLTPFFSPTLPGLAKQEAISFKLAQADAVTVTIIDAAGDDGRDARARSSGAPLQTVLAALERPPAASRAATGSLKASERAHDPAGRHRRPARAGRRIPRAREPARTAPLGALPAELHAGGAVSGRGLDAAPPRSRARSARASSRRRSSARSS